VRQSDGREAVSCRTANGICIAGGPNGRAAESGRGPECRHRNRAVAFLAGGTWLLFEPQPSPALLVDLAGSTGRRWNSPPADCRDLHPGTARCRGPADAYGNHSGGVLHHRCGECHEVYRCLNKLVDGYAVYVERNRTAVKDLIGHMYGQWPHGVLESYSYIDGYFTLFQEQTGIVTKWH
jgi:hypothetical protein